MRVFITGATGTVGWPIAKELVEHGHQVIALARSDSSAQNLRTIGATPVRGDIRDPAPWVNILGKVDAVIHAAATFTDDMGPVDNHLIACFIAEAANHRQKLKFIYTGGCWLYGDTDGQVVNEETPLKPIDGFAWMARNMQTMRETPVFDTCIIHPACVYDRDSGAIARFIDSAKQDEPITIWGSPDIRWTMVHRQDLARAYRLVLEAGEPGQCYNVASQQSVRVGDLAKSIQTRFNSTALTQIEPVETGVAAHGAWVFGTVLDQQMSSEKISRTLGWTPHYPDTCAEIS